MAKKEHEHKCECGHEHGHEEDNNMEEQRRMLEQQILQQKLMEIESQLNQVEQKKQELEMVSESISSLDGKTNAEIMVPIGMGVLGKAKLLDSNEFLVNIGSNIVVTKSAEETKKLIEAQISELDRARELFEQELQRILTV
ncbi:MAG: prefoldin subunit alpha [Candidatus Nanoarchaeia archaeon]|nr:prefoldin subunit alpha [Candidatus Nanoarchaeia archaeon]MDD5239596.1 prefoldin subunit alpha [Candidatus Nanoarchaeia archaeon]